MFSCRIYGLEIVKNMSCYPVWKNKFLFLKLISKCFQIHKWIETLTSGIILNFLIFLMNFMQLKIRFDKSDPSFFLPSESFEYHIWELISFISFPEMKCRPIFLWTHFKNNEHQLFWKRFVLFAGIFVSKICKKSNLVIHDKLSKVVFIDLLWPYFGHFANGIYLTE